MTEKPRRRSMDDLVGEDPPDTDPDLVPAAESDWAKIRQGVTIGWLAGALRMDRKTVKKRLGALAPKAKKPNGDLYDLEMAMSHLVKPRFDIREYLKTMNPTELPPNLRKEYWDAELKKARWQREAGELWTTDDVVSVLADAFMQIKNLTQVWADDVEREAGLTPAQYGALRARVDSLREELYSALSDMPNQKHTGSLLEEGIVDDDDDDPT